MSRTYTPKKPRDVIEAFKNSPDSIYDDGGFDMNVWGTEVMTDVCVHADYFDVFRNPRSLFASSVRYIPFKASEARAKEGAEKLRNFCRNTSLVHTVYGKYITPDIMSVEDFKSWVEEFALFLDVSGGYEVPC